jgi:hypothetical protein
MPEHQLIEINENIAKRNISSIEEFSEWTQTLIKYVFMCRYLFILQGKKRRQCRA